MSDSLLSYPSTHCGGTGGGAPCTWAARGPRPLPRPEPQCLSCGGPDTRHSSLDSLNLHALTPRSLANGPDWRFVIHLQGCARRCPGCFNPDTHDFAPRLVLSPARLVGDVMAERGLEGVTISGGEPLDQSPALLQFLSLLRERSALSVILFTGFTRCEANATPDARQVLGHVDVLVDGPYVAAQRIAAGLRGSSNQRIHFLTDRYSPSDLAGPGAAEVIIGPDGHLVLTGFDPPTLP